MNSSRCKHHIIFYKGPHQIVCISRFAPQPRGVKQMAAKKRLCCKEVMPLVAQDGSGKFGMSYVSDFTMILLFKTNTLALTNTEHHPCLSFSSLWLLF